MSDQFCPNCGKSVPQGAKFCESCGYSLQASKTDITTQQTQVKQQPPDYQQQSPAYQQQGQYPPPQYQKGGFMNRFQKPPDYTIPPNYIETTTMTQRLVGTLKMDVHVVEEIERRADLQSEAQKLLFVSLFFITLFEIIAILSLPDKYKIFSTEGTIVETIYVNFFAEYALIYLIARVGKSIGGTETNTSTEEMLRMLSYAYFIRAIAQVASVVGQTNDSGAIELVSDLLFLYSIIVYIFVIRRGLDKGYIMTILTIVVAFLLWLIIIAVGGAAIFEIFKETYEIIPEPK